MPITGRRAFLALALPLIVAAECLGSEEETPLSRLAKLASALSQGDSVNALDCFDRAIKNYGEISRSIDALTAQTDLLCAIDIVEDIQDGDAHQLDTDWYVQIKSRSDQGLVERRRQRVSVRMEKIQSKWKITSLSPATILSPLSVQ